MLWVWILAKEQAFVDAACNALPAFPLGWFHLDGVSSDSSVNGLQLAQKMGLYLSVPYLGDYVAGTGVMVTVFFLMILLAFICIAVLLCIKIARFVTLGGG